MSKGLIVVYHDGRSESIEMPEYVDKEELIRKAVGLYLRLRDECKSMVRVSRGRG